VEDFGNLSPKLGDRPKCQLMYDFKERLQIFFENFFEEKNPNTPNTRLIVFFNMSSKIKNSKRLAIINTTCSILRPIN
jgi:hypothetical protein